MTAGNQSRSGAAAMWLFVLLLVLAVGGCVGGVSLNPPEPPPLTDNNRALYANVNLMKARALIAEGRFDHAESVARRGLLFELDNTKLLRLRAHALEELGQVEKAAILRARADELDPPAAPPPTTPHALADAGGNIVLLLVPPATSVREQRGHRNRVPQNWPAGEEAASLSQALARRLPNARIHLLAGDEPWATVSVPLARTWLAQQHADAVVSLRVDRAFCGHTQKDGAFGVAWLRVTTAIPNSDAPADAHLIRVSIDDPPEIGCRALAIQHAVERTLELIDVREALQAARGGAEESSSSSLDSPSLSSPSLNSPYASNAVRVLLPDLGTQLESELAQGRRYLAVGELTRAIVHFERGEAIDPDDLSVGSFLEHARLSLETARLLEADASPGGPIEALPAQLTQTQRIGMEAQLAHEERRREEMLSALAVLYENRSAPTPGTIAAMYQGSVRDPSATGLALAIPLAPPDSAIEVRSLFAPDGGVLARYYFVEGSSAPILREDDSNGDGIPDRWVAYQNGILREVWEGHGDQGPPTLHLVYAVGGNPIERVELDHNADGVTDRLFVYDDGMLRHESSDTNGDGAFDRFQLFDDSGSLTMREEDVDGDMEIDIRTAYIEGRIVRREILNPELLSEFQ